jgi:hypothetical protein
MKKIGLFLAYKSTNYGAQLQAYATQMMIDSLGVNTEIIEYPLNGKLENAQFSWGLIYEIVRLIRSKKRQSRERTSDDPVFTKEKKVRKDVSNDFISRRLHDVKHIEGYNNLVNAGKCYDAVLIGSDQKWLPGFSFWKPSTFAFVSDKVRRISYATSLGVSEYPKYCWPTARKAWRSMNYLSVREEQGAEIIRQVCGNDINVEVVADPTYLLSKEKWEEVVPIEKKTDEKYVLCYFLGNSVKSKEIARQFADAKGLKLYSILSVESISPIDQTFADTLITGAAPEDFINWIRGAEYVITDSFHGLTFSVINEKQFYVFYRKRDGVQSRNSRIDNILKKWNVEDRLVKTGDSVASMLNTPDIEYQDVSSLVEGERNHSYEFLKKALTFDDDK